MHKRKRPGPAATGSRASHAEKVSYFPDFPHLTKQDYYWITVLPTGSEEHFSRKPVQTKALLAWNQDGWEYTATWKVRPVHPASGPLITVRPPGNGWKLYRDDDPGAAIWCRRLAGERP
jgi:hypothetical protein